jgi:cytidylate kinase
VEKNPVVSVPVIAIDGPSASGKGAVASRVAEALGFHYLESGALYRVLALVALRSGETGEPGLVLAATTMPLRFQGGRILLSNQDVSEDIRSEACGNRASEVARIPAVRQTLLTRQRSFRQAPGLVADGRDMGTIVFPDAALKVFLTASPEVRAERRYKQLIDKGIPANLRSLSRDLAERDERDRKRSVAPLVPAPDSQVLDSSALSIDQVVEQVLGWWREKKTVGGARARPDS